MTVTNHTAQRRTSLVCDSLYLLNVLDVPGFVSKYSTMLQAWFERHLGVRVKDHHTVKQRATFLLEAFLQENPILCFWLKNNPVLK